MAETAPAEQLTGLPAVPFRAFLTVPRYPYCPACGEPLAPDAWSVRYCLAVCWKCKNHRLQSVYAANLSMRQPELREHVTMRHGIAFLTPAYREFAMLPALAILEKACAGRPLFELPEDLPGEPATIEKTTFTEEEQAAIRSAADRLPTRSQQS